MRIVCQQTILMKHHALFVIFEKAAKFEIVVCCKLYVALYGLIYPYLVIIEHYPNSNLTSQLGNINPNSNNTKL